jgi:hypothetical protein
MNVITEYLDFRLTISTSVWLCLTWAGVKRFRSQHRFSEIGAKSWTISEKVYEMCIMHKKALLNTVRRIVIEDRI